MTGRDREAVRRDPASGQSGPGDTDAQMIVRAWTARGPVLVGLVALVVLLGGFGTWAFTSRIASAIVAPGAIEVEQNRQVVQHLDGGVVSAILVKEGDRVEAGQVLVRLDPERLQTELTIVESQLFELMARRGRLEAERDGSAVVTFADGLVTAATGSAEVGEILESNRTLFAQRRENLEASLDQMRKRGGQIESLIGGLDAQLTALATQTRLVADELANQMTLRDKGLAQAATILNLEREKAQIEGQVGEIVATKAQYEGRITENELEVLRTEAQWREDAIAALSEQEGRELELAERRRALREQLDRLDIRAPVAGAIHALQIYGERAVLQPAQTVLFIVPQDRPLIIGAQVEPIHVDEIHLGQDVVLRFPAFDRRQTPELTGRIVTISPDALQDERTGRSFYRVRIELSPGEIEKLPEGDVLIPGMPVEAYVTTGERSPFAYLVKPFTDYFNRAFRER